MNWNFKKNKETCMKNKSVISLFYLHILREKSKKIKMAQSPPPRKKYCIKLQFFQLKKFHATVFFLTDPHQNCEHLYHEQLIIFR